MTAHDHNPCIISTWTHGEAANRAGWVALARGASALDSVELAVKTAEADPSVRSVGLGGFPDRDGRVTLDAAIMDHRFRCGAVAGLEHVMHAVSVARAVMESTTHVMIAGAGALEFALSRGFVKERLITSETLRIYEERHERNATPVANIENHDTISTLALDSDGRIAGACTTSGLTGRLHGRVGDSPIIGAGLYIDGDIGGAAATGLGELAVRVAASSMAVERMRLGATPQEACGYVINFIRTRLEPSDSQQLALIAIAPDGRTGADALLAGFSYVVTRDSGGPSRAVYVEPEIHDT
ncbi:MAG: N(4)-(beta-N-acetylglucosaminyl)-L-asparaginase [Spirochaetota bacterium]